MLQTPLHAPTVLLMTVLVVSMMSAVILVFWRFNRGLPYIHCWGFAALSGQGALITMGLRDHLPELVSMWLLNGLLFAVPYLLFYGSRIYLGLAKPNWRQAVAIGIGVLTVMAFFTVVHPNLTARIVLNSAVLGYLYVLVARTIATGAWRRFPARYAFALTMAAHAVFMLSARPWVLITEGDPTNHRFILNSLIPLESLVFYLLQTVTIILLVVEHLSAKLIAQSEIDPLTQVFNRRAFMTLLHKVRSQWERQRLPLVLMMIDLDHFKRINDSWGHKAGDHVLRRFAQLAATVLRNEDVMGRLGGEEFCIALTGVHLSEAQWIGERLREACEKETILFEGTHIGFTISAGIALVKVGDTLEAAIHHADQAMYSAKRVGRNRVEFASERPSDVMALA